jgi:hypothetical protein
MTRLLVIFFAGSEFDSSGFAPDLVTAIRDNPVVSMHLYCCGEVL